MEEKTNAKTAIEKMLPKVKKFINSRQYVSVSTIQSQFCVGYPFALRVMGELEKLGIVRKLSDNTGRYIVANQNNIPYNFGISKIDEFVDNEQNIYIIANEPSNSYSNTRCVRALAYNWIHTNLTNGESVAVIHTMQNSLVNILTRMHNEFDFENQDDINMSINNATSGKNIAVIITLLTLFFL